MSSKNVLMTGGTGMIGARLGVELLKRQQKVIFPIRSAQPQLEAKMRVYNPNFSLSDYDYEVLSDADITLLQFGFNNKTIENLKAQRIDRLYATAGCITFDPDKAELVKRTNVDGLYNSLALAEELDIPLVVVFSTAYVGGKFQGRFMESDLDRDQLWNNAYEESKYRVEREAHEWAKRTSRNIIIIRPAIVVGEPATTTFMGYYYVFKSLWIVGNNAKKQLAKDNPNYFGTGIRVLQNGLLSLPLTMLCRKESVASLIPVDWFCRTVANLVDKPEATGKTFNLTHPDPAPMEWLIETSARLVGVTHLCLEDPDAMPTKEEIQRILYGNGLRHSMQKQLDTAIREYVYYMCTHLTFDNRNVKSVLGDDYEDPPEINEAFLAERLEYAKKLRFKEQGDLRLSKTLTKSHPLLAKAY